MFARYFVELPLAAPVVEELLLREPGAWLPLIAEEANGHGDRLLAEIGFGEAVRVRRRVAIELGAPVRMPSKTVVPLRWRPIGAGGLFPDLDADLEIAALGPQRAQVAISARYVPPFGAIGRAIDRVVMNRVAEATIKDFLDRVGDALAAQARSDGAAAGAPAQG
ncbi:MAG: hypothetical protein KatS3mg013_0930 [Actinomycetota bacterium]|nr:MAG: hypothetical protein KatS3mg013_0930 [Actinomycetota bacterium]